MAEIYLDYAVQRSYKDLHANADLLFLLFVFFPIFSGHRSVRAIKLGSPVGLHEGSPPNIFGDDLH